MDIRELLKKASLFRFKSQTPEEVPADLIDDIVGHSKWNLADPNVTQEYKDALRGSLQRMRSQGHEYAHLSNIVSQLPELVEERKRVEEVLQRTGVEAPEVLEKYLARSQFPGMVAKGAGEVQDTLKKLKAAEDILIPYAQQFTGAGPHSPMSSGSPVDFRTMQKNVVQELQDAGVMGFVDPTQRGSRNLHDPFKLSRYTSEGFERGLPSLTAEVIKKPPAEPLSFTLSEMKSKPKPVVSAPIPVAEVPKITVSDSTMEDVMALTQKAQQSAEDTEGLWSKIPTWGKVLGGVGLAGGLGYGAYKMLSDKTASAQGEVPALSPALQQAITDHPEWKRVAIGGLTESSDDYMNRMAETLHQMRADTFGPGRAKAYYPNLHALSAQLPELGAKRQEIESVIEALGGADAVRQLAEKSPNLANTHIIQNNLADLEKHLGHIRKAEELIMPAAGQYIGMGGDKAHVLNHDTLDALQGNLIDELGLSGAHNAVAHHEAYGVHPYTQPHTRADKRLQELQKVVGEEQRLQEELASRPKPAPKPVATKPKPKVVVDTSDFLGTGGASSAGAATDAAQAADNTQSLWSKIPTWGKALGGAALAGGLGYGAYKLLNNDKTAGVDMNDAYVQEFLKIAQGETAAKPGLMHNIGTGFQELGQLNPLKDGALGSHVRKAWGENVAAQAKNLGNESLSIGQKMRPAWETLKSTAKNFKNPLMAAGLMTAAAAPVAYGGAKAVGSVMGGGQPRYR